jgi:hypothetical protein
LDLVAAWRREDPSPNLQAFLEIVHELAPVEIQAGAATAPNGQASAET